MIFPGYNPFHQSHPDPAPSASAEQKLAARRAGATHIAGDGYYCYRWNAGRLESKQWYSDRYSMNWLDTGKEEMPPAAVKVE